MRTKRSWLCEFEEPHTNKSRLRSGVTSKVCVWYETEAGGGGGSRVKHMRREYLPKSAAGIGGGGEGGDPTHRECSGERGKKGLEKRAGKGNQPTRFHNILFKLTLNKNIVYKSKETLKV